VKGRGEKSKSGSNGPHDPVPGKAFWSTFSRRKTTRWITSGGEKNDQERPDPFCRKKGQVHPSNVLERGKSPSPIIPNVSGYKHWGMKRMGYSENLGG